MWGKESLDDPIESVLDSGMKSSAASLARIFTLSSAEAASVVQSFLRSLGVTRTPREVAELVAHQGSEEIAIGAFFCTHLKHGEYYSADYLEWRKNHHAQRRRQ